MHTPTTSEATPDQIQAAIDSVPVCGTCGKAIRLVHFVSHETHRFSYEIDASNADVLAYTTHYETLDREPELKDKAALVECERGHLWYEPRLRLWTHSASIDEWEVLART